MTIRDVMANLRRVNYTCEGVWLVFEGGCDGPDIVASYFSGQLDCMATEREGGAFLISPRDTYSMHDFWDSVGDLIDATGARSFSRSVETFGEVDEIPPE